MIIKSLDLIGFGKFHHRQTELGPRVNVIYGGNEAGKSTMHRFIHGCFLDLNGAGAKAPQRMIIRGISRGKMVSAMKG